MHGNTRHDHHQPTRQPDRHTPPRHVADPGAEPGVGDRHRRLAAARGAKRTLAARPQTLRERLDGLLADSPGAYDLDAWPDMYGNDDGIVGELERRTADALGAEAAAFFPTGTMAQQVALRCWAGRTGNATVAGHPLSHMEVHERDAYATVSGLRMVHPTGEPRTPTADEVHALQEPFGTLALELPLRDAGFVLPGWDELTASVEAARERDAVVHFDGARLWECTPHFGRGLPEIAALADSVYVSFYKSLGGIGGAALVGSESFIEETRAWRHRYGGQIFQQWPTALTALAGLDAELPRLPAYVAQAKDVARALTEGLAESSVPWFRVHPREPHTHQFRLWLPYPAQALNDAGLRQARETGTSMFQTWFEDATPGLATTEVTVQAPALEWTAADIRAALADFVARVTAA
ncbi:threonine aldolase family protein [Streptomyces benahoarensis]|uniref:Threonine aldolase n=1 Tax=Streptomyces benahoarensis TaxID=2595054 RepID=A0A553YR30_9ACTN|nr:beta-eliminating lyase-related protein [Streptomyces benahoarensis]TSB16669.1 threonine aldolase [Streptomyces benahoarensis]TSB31657.1 threonine aldolase [Streptomyces benahoarensis]